jgi:hypothetical protein
LEGGFPSLYKGLLINMKLRSGTTTHPSPHFFETIRSRLGKLSSRDMERYVQKLIVHGFDRKIAPVLNSPLENKSLTTVVLCICSNICFTSDENIEKFVFLLPNILPLSLDLLSDYELGSHVAAMLGNLSACPSVCTRLLVNYDLLSKLENLLQRDICSPSYTGMNVSLCQLMYNIAFSPLMRSSHNLESARRILVKLVSRASDVEAYEYILHSYKNLPSHPPELIHRLSKRLDRVRKLISQVDSLTVAV